MSVLTANLAEIVDIEPDLDQPAKELDKHYIPTRYPNGFERGAPVDFYTEPEARQAIENAEAILAFCRHQVAG